MSERDVFTAAREMSDPTARSAYLDRACANDRGLRHRVEALLGAHDQPDSLLDNPAVPPHDPDSATTRAFDHDGGKADDDEIPLGFLEPATRPDSLGRIGHYEVLQVLGKGGFGIVFRAFDEVLHRVVAVKVLSPHMAATSPARKRFLREARSSARVRHENVVQVYEVGETPLPYIAMEFVPGETLQQRLDHSGPVGVVEVLRIGRQIAEGLAAAHAADLIHRDIKPANILLEGGQNRVKITDFGLARAADDASISQSGIIAGTPMYMAPEQAKGETLDQRADLFSLGSVLYQMAAGRSPFRATGTLAVLKRVAEDTPRPIREIIPETPQWLCDIIAKLHAKKPEDRFQSAREVADVLADCEAQLKANAKLKDFSRIPKSKQPAAGKSGRWKWAAAAALLLPVIVLAVTEIAGVTHLFRNSTPERDLLVRGGGVTPNLVANADPLIPSPKRRLFASDEWIDVIPLIDPQLDKCDLSFTGKNEWHFEEGQLVVGDVDKRANKLVLPLDLSFSSFECELEMTRRAGDGGINFNLPVVDGDTQMSLDPVLRQKGVHLTKRGERGQFTLSDVTLIENGKRVKLRVELRRGQIEDRFTVWKDGTQIGSWTGDREGLTKKTNEGYPAQRRLSLWIFEGGNEFVFHRIRVRMLDGGTAETLRPVPSSSAPSVTPEPLARTVKNGIGMEFVIVPKGKSWLGGGKDKQGDKEVEILADFYLSKYEVTQEEWTQVMGENPSHFTRNGEGKEAVKDCNDADLKRFPVENVSWDNCQLFVAKLNEREKEKGWVYRLPKEVEWEYACRGGPMPDKLDSAFDYYFAKPTNTLLPEQANFNAGLNRTSKVGFYEPNRLGLFDMHGNVTEYCDDAEKVDDGALYRVVRGGNWTTNSDIRQATWRFVGPPSGLNLLVGLRLARVPSDPDRRAAEYVLSIGGKVMVNEKQTEVIAAATNLPRESFKLTYVGLMGNELTDSGLAVFKDCNNLLTGLDMHGCKTLTDLGLENFKNCKNLVYLNLTETPVTSAGLAHLKGCKNLSFLHLRETQVTDRDLALFAKDMPLKILNLGSTRITDAGLANLAECKTLTNLFLDATAISDVGLAHLAGLDKLIELKLTMTKVTAKGVEGLAKALPNCKIEWDVGVIEPKVAVAPFTDADVKRIAALPAAEQVEEVRKELQRRNPGFDGKVEHKIEDGAVTELRIVTDQVTDIAPLRVFNALAALDCSGTQTNWRGNGQLSDLTPLRGMTFTGLTHLDLNWTKVSDAGLAHFKDCKGLSRLGLHNTPVSDVGLAYFKDCKSLTHLAVGLSISVTDKGLANFKDCKNLTFLNLDSLPVSDAGLAYFKDCKNLTHLNLNSTRVSDVGLAHFKVCNDLSYLSLYHTQVSDAGLALFKDCNDLTVLFIDRTKVTDFSLLKRMPLKELRCDFQPERDAEILRSIKTLKTINGKPAEEFWKEVDKK